MGRRRKLLAITLLVMSVLLLAAMLVTLRWSIVARRGRWVFFAGNQAFGYMYFPGSSRTDARIDILEMSPELRKTRLWFPDDTSVWNAGVMKYTSLNGFGTVMRRLDVLMWPWAVTGGVSSLVLWLGAARWRRRAGLCPCGYSRAGLHADAACPECGRLPAEYASVTETPR